ncbi:hypothetical protein P9112_006862 [Eukaryota sp. TZLM1-RC]
MRTALLLLFLSVAFAAVYVSPDGNDDNPCTEMEPCQSFQHAQSVLESDHTIRFLPGEYSISDEHPRYKIHKEQIFIESTNGMSNTTINCNDDGEGPLLSIIDEPQTQFITGFTFTNCPRGVFSLHRASLKATNIAITDTSGSTGVAFHLNGDSSLFLIDSHLSNVHSDQDAPIFGATRSTISIINSTFSDISSTQKGGLFNIQSHSTLSIADSSFDSVSSKLEGGIIFALNTNTSLVNLSITNTKAVADAEPPMPAQAGSGGAFYFENCLEVELFDISVINSTAGRGGLLYAFDSSITANGVFLSNSHARLGGSAVYVSGKELFILKNGSFSLLESLHNGGFWFDFVDNIYLSDITITDSTANGGAAFFINGGEEASLTNIDITRSSYYPLTIISHPKVTLDTVTVEESVGHSGSYISHSIVSFRDCSFSHNTAYDDTNGGAIIIAKSGHVDFDNCYFELNSAFRGGAIFRSVFYDVKFPHSEIKYTVDGNIKTTVTNSIFFNNSAVVGGALYTEGKEHQGIILTDDFTELHSLNNTASAFGDFHATDPRKLELVELNYFSNELQEPSMQVIIALLDQFNQLFTQYHPQFTVNIYPDDSELSLKGELFKPVLGGLADFESIALHASPAVYDVVAMFYGPDTVSVTLERFNISIEECRSGQGFVRGECIICPVGYYQNETIHMEPCKPCPEGTWSYNLGSSMCTPCPVGTFRLDDDECQPCPARTFAANISSTYCDACPPRQISNLQRDDCVCEGGMVPYYDEFGEMDCERCPQGILCFGHNETCVLEGYWRPPSEDLISNLQNIYECTLGDCMGGCFAFLAGLPDPTPETLGCAEGATGVRCELCIEGYTHVEPYCEPCPPDFMPWILFFSTILIYILLALVIHIDVSTGLQSLASYKPLVRYCQMLGACLLIYAVPYPNSLRYFLFFTRFILSDMSKLYWQNCSLGKTATDGAFYNVTFFSGVAVLPAIWIFFLAYFMIRKIFFMAGSNALKRTVQSALVATQLFFPVVFGSFLPLFSCSSITIDGFTDYYLDIDSNILCYSTDWWLKVSIVALFFVIWASMWAKAFHLYANQHPNMEQAELETKTLFAISAAYKLKSPLFELIDQVFVVLLTGTLFLVSRGTAFQLAVGLCVVFANIAYHSQSWPLNFPWQNKMQLLYLVGVLAVVVFGLVIRLMTTRNIPYFFLYDSNSEQQLDPSISLWAVVVTIILVLILLIGLVSTVRYHFRRKMKESELSKGNDGFVFRTNKLINPLVNLQNLSAPTIELPTAEQTRL